MLVKRIAIVVFCCSLGVSAAAAPQVDARTKHVRQAIQMVVDKRGLGPEAHIALQLKDKAKIEGYVSRLGQDDFEVTNLSLHTKRTIYFRDVDKVVSDMRQILGKGRRDTGTL